MLSLTDKVSYDVDDGVAILSLNNPPVNALSHGVREGLKLGVEKAEADSGVVALVILCEGRTFIAGADITEFGAAPKEPDLHSVLAALENCSLPTVACLLLAACCCCCCCCYGSCECLLLRMLLRMGGSKLVGAQHNGCGVWFHAPCFLG